MKYMWAFTPSGTGTTLQFHMEKIRNRKQQEIWQAMREQFAAQMGPWFARLAELLGQDTASREPDAEVIEKHELHRHQEATPEPAPPHAH